MKLLLLFSLLGPATAADTASPDNPHGDPDACTACHAPAAPGEYAGAVLPIVATCRSCHPTADMHPVGVAPDEVPVPERFPLENGLVTCATCHVEPAHGGDAMIPPPYHRGGPYKDVRQLCYSCHERSTYTRTDPHHPDTPRSNDDSTCAACHSGVPETGASPADARLRFPTSESCKTCHDGSLHQGVGDHVGKTLPADALAGLSPLVPVDPDGTVQCWSCHDVHGHLEGQAPDIQKRWTGARPLADELRADALAGPWKDQVAGDVTWPGLVQPEHPPLLAMPIVDGTLCQACHGDGP